MSKGVRTVVTAVTFMVAMAVCAVVVLDPEIDWWLLKYAVAIGASLAGIFLMGILILFVCTNVESEKADAIGTVVSLPFLYFGLMDFSCWHPVLQFRGCCHQKPFQRQMQSVRVYC